MGLNLGTSHQCSKKCFNEISKIVCSQYHSVLESFQRSILETRDSFYENEIHESGDQLKFCTKPIISTRICIAELKEKLQCLSFSSHKCQIVLIIKAILLTNDLILNL